MDLVDLKNTRQDKVADHNERVSRQISLAGELEEAGHYEAAAAALAFVWPRVGERPALEGLDRETAAALLLRAGALTGWLGSARQLAGSQETAKDLISESERYFMELGKPDSSADARIDLAICYWRQGGFDEARDQLREVLGLKVDDEVTKRALLNLSVVEISAARYQSALVALEQARPLFEAQASRIQKGRFHSQVALCYQMLGFGEQREDYLDRALLESAIAGKHFAEAGHTRYLARVENNVGNVLYKMGKFTRALQHMDRARELLIPLKDSGTVAQINEARARVLLLQERYAEAETAAAGAVHILERGDEQSLLAEVLITQGTAFARLGDPLPALRALRRAIYLAEQSGDLFGAGCAAVTILEELFNHLTPSEQVEIYSTADRLLGNIEDLSLLARLRSVAGRILAAQCVNQCVNQGQANFDDFPLGSSLDDEILRLEAVMIRRALEQAQGKPTEAARALGITHQRLSFILQTRHRALLPARVPIQRRRKSIIKKQKLRK